jgi:hypothetical protein
MMKYMKFIPINIHKLGFKPYPDELEKASEILKELLKEWVEIEDDEKRLETPIDRELINKRGKRLIHGTRMFDIISQMLNTITYGEDNAIPPPNAS